MSALGQKRTFAAYALLSIATAKADTEADAPPEQGGGLDCGPYAQIRGITLHYL